MMEHNQKGSTETSSSEPDGLHESKKEGGTNFSTQSRSGLLSIIPRSFVPYAELMRITKPAGHWACFFPHLIGSLHAATWLKPAGSAPLLSELISVNGLMLGGTLFFRGVACTWNDILDRDYDRQVERCKNRPIARGAVSRMQAFVFMLALVAVGVAVFYLPLPRACLAPTALLSASQAVYPLFKRFTNYPQLWLGISFACGVLVGAGAVGLDLIVVAMEATDRQLCASFRLLYAALVINIVIYDTVYGHQDLKDDLRVNVKSIAVAWRDDTKRNCMILAAVEVGLLGLVGVTSNYGMLYFTVAVGGTAGVLAALLYQVRLDIPASCMAHFNLLIGLTGTTVAAGLFFEYRGTMQLGRLYF